MRAVRVFLLALAFSCVLSPAAHADDAALEGAWAGVIEAGGAQLHLILHLTRGDDGAWRATMDSIDQGARGIAATSVTVDSTSLRFEIATIGGSYTGTFDAGHTTITGTWSQSGVSLPLNLRHTDTPEEAMPARPQTPKPPFPYTDTDVTFPSRADGITIAGTLSIPDGNGPHPAVLLITGSGPQDRDETVMGHKPFLILADYLARRGIAVLRCDDRGVGESTGDFATGTIEDFAQDARGAVDFLKHREGIDAQRIGLIGHSEGGMVAPLVAAQDDPGVAFIVLMAGVGIPMQDVMTDQARRLLEANGASPDFIERNARVQQQMFDIVRSEPDREAAEAKLRDAVQVMFEGLDDNQKRAMEAAAESSIQLVNSPWFRFLLHYDPAATLRQVHVPVLALDGSLDLQVSAKQNLPAIEKALHEGGNTDVTTITLPNLNHLFQTATTGSPSEYSRIEETMAPVALKTISDWILAHTGKTKTR